MKKQPLSLVLCCTLSTYQSKTVIHAALHLLLLKLDACIHRNELRFETLNLSIQMSDQWNQFNIYLIHHKLGQLKQKLWSRNMSALNTFQSPLAFNNQWWMLDGLIESDLFRQTHRLASTVTREGLFFLFENWQLQEPARCWQSGPQEADVGMARPSNWKCSVHSRSAEQHRKH